MYVFLSSFHCVDRVHYTRLSLDICSKSHNRNDASPEAPDQNTNSDQRDSKNDDYDNVYDVIDDSYTGLSERSGSATYTSLATSTEATDAPVYLEILPEA